MIAVLFNSADVRLGEMAVSDDCRIIEFGGAVFAWTNGASPLDRGGLGRTFEQSIIDVRRDLDVFDPRKAVAADRVAPPYLHCDMAHGEVDLVDVWAKADDCVRNWHVDNPRNAPKFVGDFKRLTDLAAALTPKKAASAEEKTT